jgi:hypothetical protein
MRLWSARRSSVSPSTDASTGPAGEGADGAWAGVRFDPALAHRGHVESWFLKANDPHGRRAIWLKWTIWAGDHAPACTLAEAWAVAFGTARGHVATKVSVPFEQASFTPGALGATVDGSVLSPDGAHGRVASGGRAIDYELTIASLEGPYTLYGPRWMYTGPIPSQKVVSPIPNARISGQVEVDGERWALDGWPGMVGHNWGRHTELYVWGHCNAWDDGDDVVLEGASGRVRAGGVLLPLRTGMVVRHHGTTYRLSNLASLARNESTLTPRRWQFRCVGSRVEVEGEVWAETDDFVGLFYPNPSGAMIHCLNSKIASAEVTLRIAGRAPKTLRSTRAALEIGTTDPHHGVRMTV